MIGFFKFSWWKAVVSVVLAFILLVLSRLFMTACGIDVHCPHPESTFFLVLMWIVIAYLVVIILLKIATKK